MAERLLKLYEQLIEDDLVTRPTAAGTREEVRGT
jgi:hypothetical protein